MSLMVQTKTSRQRISKTSAHQTTISTLQPGKASATKGRKVTHSQPSTSDTSDDGYSSTSDYDGLNEHQIALKRQEQQKRRKARNQRRYYKRCATSRTSKTYLNDSSLTRNKAEQQAKGRERVARYMRC